MSHPTVGKHDLYFLLLTFGHLVFRPLCLRVVAPLIIVLIASIFSPVLRVKHLLFTPIFFILKICKNIMKDSVFMCASVWILMSGGHRWEPWGRIIIMTPVWMLQKQTETGGCKVVKNFIT